MQAVLETPAIATELPPKLTPPQLLPHLFQPGHARNGAGRPAGRRASWRMIGELVKQHPEYKSSIRALLQASNCSTQLVAEALIRRVEDRDWRPQLRAVELIARITGELKEATIIQQQAVSVEDTTKLRALAEQLLAARHTPSVAAPVAAAIPQPSDAASSSDMVKQQVDLMNQQGISGDQSTEHQDPTPPLLP